MKPEDDGGPGEAAVHEEEARLRDLIVRARAGDRPAQERLMAYYRPRLRRWAAYRLAGTPHDPSSATQEVLARMYRGLPRLRGDAPRQLERWLRTTLDNLIASAERERSARKRSGDGKVAGDEDASPTPSRHLRERQGRWRLQQLISRLPGDQGQALWRRHIEDWTVSEIAAAMGRTGPEVSNLLWRAREALRRQIADDGEVVLPEEEERLGPLIDRAMVEYEARAAAGEAIDREAFLVAHAACAGVLRRILSWADRIAAWSREG